MVAGLPPLLALYIRKRMTYSCTYKHVAQACGVVNKANAARLGFARVTRSVSVQPETWEAVLLQAVALVTTPTKSASPLNCALAATGFSSAVAVAVLIFHASCGYNRAPLAAVPVCGVVAGNLAYKVHVKKSMKIA